MITRGGVFVAMMPEGLPYKVESYWPSDLSKLFLEAVRAYAAGAYTASTMVARKLLMTIACKEGDEAGKNFAQYVKYLSEEVICVPGAREWIDQVRTIGNDATHQIEFVPQEKAKLALDVTQYIFATLYFPARRHVAG